MAVSGSRDAGANAASASLCTPDETILFSCPIRDKLVSVCGQASGRAVYRFGRVELQSGGLSHSRRGYSGGGESQIRFERGAYRYILFDKTVRTGFDGRNDPQSSSGLVIQRGDRRVSSTTCDGSGESQGSGALADYSLKTNSSTIEGRPHSGLPSLSR